jgi:hypothetical protein
MICHSDEFSVHTYSETRTPLSVASFSRYTFQTGRVIIQSAAPLEPFLDQPAHEGCRRRGQRQAHQQIVLLHAVRRFDLTAKLNQENLRDDVYEANYLSALLFGFILLLEVEIGCYRERSQSQDRCKQSVNEVDG